MFTLTCPVCGARTSGEDTLAGKRVECPHCHAVSTAPGSTQHDDSPAHAVAAPEDAVRARIGPPSSYTDTMFRDGMPPLREAPLPSMRNDLPRIFMRIVLVLVVIGLGLTAVLLLVPPMVRIRGDDVRMQSTSNLKQISLAMASFHDANKFLPFNGSDGGDGQGKTIAMAVASNPRSGSWAFQILPYIDQTPMFIDGPVGRSLTTGISAYMDTGRGRPWFATGPGIQSGPWTDYYINIYANTGMIGIGAWSQPDSRRTMVGITDGTSNTIFAGEGTIATGLYATATPFAGAGTIWIGGTEGTARGGANVVGAAGPNVLLQHDPAGPPQPGTPISWGGPFPQGGLMGMGDGTVHMFAYSMSGTTFGAFLTPAHGENVVVPQ